MQRHTEIRKGTRVRHTFHVLGRLGAVAGLAAVGLLVRLALIATTPASFDVESYGVVAGLLVAGRPVYLETERYNYAPVWMWLLGGIWHLATWAGIDFTLLVRAVVAAIDTALGLVIYGLLRRRHKVSQPAALALSVLNPILVLNAGVHGQFDPLATLLMLGAIVLLPTGGPHEPSGWRLPMAGLLLGLSIAVKHFPVLALPALLVAQPRWRDRLVLAALATLPTLVAFAPVWPTQAEGVLGNVVGYSGGKFPWWGLGAVAYALGKAATWPGLDTLALPIATLREWLLAYSRYLAAAAIGMVALMGARRVSPNTHVVLAFLLFYALVVNFGAYYLVWIVPFIALYGAESKGGLRLALLWTLLASLYSAASHGYEALITVQANGPVLQILFGATIFTGILAWAACLMMAAIIVRTVDSTARRVIVARESVVPFTS